MSWFLQWSQETVRQSRFRGEACPRYRSETFLGLFVACVLFTSTLHRYPNAPHCTSESSSPSIYNISSEHITTFRLKMKISAPKSFTPSRGDETLLTKYEELCWHCGEHLSKPIITTGHRPERPRPYLSWDDFVLYEFYFSVGRCHRRSHSSSLTSSPSSIDGLLDENEQSGYEPECESSRSQDDVDGDAEESITEFELDSGLAHNDLYSADDLERLSTAISLEPSEAANLLGSSSPPPESDGASLHSSGYSAHGQDDIGTPPWDSLTISTSSPPSTPESGVMSEIGGLSELSATGYEDDLRQCRWQMRGRGVGRTEDVRSDSSGSAV